IDDRDAANLLTNCEIVVDSSQLPALEEGDYYWKDLMGCQVVTTEGYGLGKVIDMMETGSNDVLVIKANLKDAFGIKERLVPFLDGQVIKKVDLATRTIEVDWDPGF
ncbi:ribosome maturation factor RimM, partial [Salmonella enterica subsp. enterica serovar Larochelle]|nr:ribosome maturation factor RimM [Salmonella enterica subsp. enterica serovar Larochelle]